MPKSFKRVSLGIRVIVLLSLALLPLGLTAIWQTVTIINEQRAATDRALLALTEKAASRERQVIERAVGGAAALGTTARLFRNDTFRCHEFLSRFIEVSSIYAFAAFQNSEGIATCSSKTDTIDFSDTEIYTRLQLTQSLGLFVDRADPHTGQSVIIIATPVFENGVYIGHMRLHVPHTSFEPSAERLTGERPLGLITFNNEGNILTSERGLATARDALPADISLLSIRSETANTFTGTSRAGEERRYAVLPLVPGSTYALGTWEPDMALFSLTDSYWTTFILAGLMWLASAVVAYLAMHLLVIRRVRHLHKEISQFKANRRLPTGDIVGRGELYDLETDFRAMTRTIVQDEADLENAVHEKNVLLKEVHHRVKNNLQLINSIINMILRRTRNEETRRVVQRLQDRVMALASVHRSIYQAQSMDRVDASDIVREIVNQGAAIGLPTGSSVKLNIDLDHVSLYPDQAMPLSLLVSEATTNAIKYVGGPIPTITVRLDLEDDDESGQKHAVISIENTATAIPKEVESTGLGSQLVMAFTRQLNGKITIEETDDLYEISVRFPVSAFEPEDLHSAQA